MSGGAMAFFGFIALVPTLIAAVSLVGLFVDPGVLMAQVDQLAYLMPRGGAELLRGQLESIIQQHPSTLGWGAVVSVLVSLWGASNAAARLIEALHMVYDEREERGFVHVRLVALALALSAVATFAFVAGVLVGLPALLERVPSLAHLAPHAFWLRWVIFATVITAYLAFVYRFAPSRPLPSWRRVSWGSVVAMLLWLSASFALTTYAEHVGRFQETYGALGGVVALLLWFYFSGLAMLLGAELDATVHWASKGYSAGERERLTRFEARFHTIG